MTKQEEIREGIAEIYWAYQDFCVPWNHVNPEIKRKIRANLSDKILSYLHSQNVVIRVDRELPKCLYASVPFKKHPNSDETYMNNCPMAGYVATEPLVEK